MMKVRVHIVPLEYISFSATESQLFWLIPNVADALDVRCRFTFCVDDLETAGEVEALSSSLRVHIARSLWITSFPNRRLFRSSP